MEAPSGISRVNSPSRFELVPMAVPKIPIEANGIGLPVSLSTTLPSTFCWPCATTDITRKKTTNPVLFLAFILKAAKYIYYQVMKEFSCQLHRLLAERLFEYESRCTYL
jgi:hypothetical protein